MGFHSVKLNISKDQQKKALKGAKIRLTQNCIGNGQIVMLHPLNYKKVVNSKGGINLELSPGEIMASASHHNMVPKIDNVGDMGGSGLFDSIWSGIKKVGSWLKDSGVGTALADVAQTVAEPFVGADVASAGRQLLKSTTGVGIRGKKTTKKGKMSASGLYL